MCSVIYYRFWQKIADASFHLYFVRRDVVPYIFQDRWVSVDVRSRLDTITYIHTRTLLLHSKNIAQLTRRFACLVPLQCLESIISWLLSCLGVKQVRVEFLWYLYVPSSDMFDWDTWCVFFCGHVRYLSQTYQVLTDNWF